MKHKPSCVVTSILLVIGGLNWGLVGLGSFLDTNLNVVNLLLGSLPVVENIVYLVVGLAALIMLFGLIGGDDKCCAKAEEKKPEMEESSENEE